MCGIGLALGIPPPQISHILAAFTSALAHRGPDDEGTHTLTTQSGLTLGLAHRRLAILDLSTAGHQPMLDESTQNAIVFNGEIYNYREIAKDLMAKGERFTGSSDTEVLLRAYKHYDVVELLRRLRGMFAFAIWDAQRQKILVARDPCGIKPLYYVSKKNLFACASEARALVRGGIVNGSIDPAAVDSFLAFGSVQAPLCIFQDIKALLPGHLMWVEEDTTASKPYSYWDWVLAGSPKDTPSIAHCLRASTQRHLVADVPVAIFLSGGFDSTALAALSMQESDKQIKTFTLNFPEVPEMSEASAAARIAQHLGTEHHTVDLHKTDFQNYLPQYFQQQDQPSDDGLNVYLISQSVAHAGIKVCLHGVGGDELFGGYPSFVQVPKAMQLSVIPRPLRKMLAQLVAGDSVVQSKMANLLRSDLTLLDIFLVRRSVFSYEQRQKLLGHEPPLGRPGVPDSWFSYAQAQLKDCHDHFSAISMLELALYAGNKLLPDGDVMSMAHGLEVRFPLLDVDLIRTVLATPNTQKQNKKFSLDKPALTGAVKNFPFHLMSNRKQGFTLPLTKWMRHLLRDDIQSVLNELVLKFGLQPDAVKKVWHNYDSSEGGQEWLRIWQLYSLGRWLQNNHY